METFVKVVITVFFIGLVVGGIVLFSIFLIVPAERIARVGKGESITPNSGNTIDIQQFNETSVIEKLKTLFSGQLQQQQTQQSGFPTPSSGSFTEPSASPKNPSGYLPNAKLSGLLQMSDIPADAIKIAMSSGGIAPQVFEVRSKSEVTLAFTSVDGQAHLFAFEAPALADVSVGVGQNQIRTVSFIAPPTAGEYAFRCAVPGHATRGEVGKMIVR